jgi:hypothetical protein
MLTGIWTPLAKSIPSGEGASTMLLLPDGSVMVQGGTSGSTPSNQWFKLTPDSHGNYVDGAWTPLAPSHVGRFFFASDVLPDGRVYVAGGEASTEGDDSSSGEIYDPVANTWTTIAKYPGPAIDDSISETLPDGRILQSSPYTPAVYIYDPSTNTWSDGPTLPNGDKSAEEGWVKLADGSTLQYEILGSQPDSANRLILGATDAQDQWVSAGSPLIPLSSNDGTAIVPEIGPGVLLPNGNVFWIGANGHTGIYTPPSAGNPTGTWKTGPDIRDNSNQSQYAFDAPAAVEPDGKVLFAAGPVKGENGTFPTEIFEYDPSKGFVGELTQVPTPGVSLDHTGAFMTRMLVLPTGQILMNNGSQFSVYTPDGSPSRSWAPTVQKIGQNLDGSFTLTGTQLNGLDEGASYGDDAQMASNYPIVKLVDRATGTTYFARTTNWSSTWVATGTKPETVDFSLPPGVGPGIYDLSVIANGISSTPVFFVLGSSGNDEVDIYGSGDLVGVSLNGDGVDEDPESETAGVYVFTEGGSNTVNIEGTLADVPVSVDLSGGTATVDVSPTARSLGNIQGNVSVTGTGSSADILQVFDQNDHNQDTYSLWSSTITRTGSATISYTSMGQVNLYGGKADQSHAGGDTFNIGSTAKGTATMVVGGGVASDTFNVTPPDHPSGDSVGTIQGGLTILGHSQSSSYSAALNIYDDASSPNTYSVTSSTVTRAGAATITYGSITNVDLYGGDGHEIYDIESTRPGTSVTVHARSVDNTFNISPTTEDLNTIQGDLAIVGVPNSAEVLNVFDQNDPNLATYSVTSSTVSRAGAAPITYASINSVVLYGGANKDTYAIDLAGAAPGLTVHAGPGNNLFDLAAAPSTPVTLDGGAGNNTLVGPNVTDTWDITGLNKGTLGDVSFAAVQNLTGGSDLNVFVFGPVGSVSGKIDGDGGGNDWLDLSAYTSTVTVNLAAGTATGVAGGIANIRNVRGGQHVNNLTGDAQGNILIGGAGPNTIIGGSARSLLIGGEGTDTITGHSGGDILIAGSTNFDSSSLANDLALDSILAEWQSGNSYATRISHIKNGGGLNGSNRLVWGVTVHDNTATPASKLTAGAGGQDWFFGNLAHTTTNKKPGEQLN